MMVDVPTVARPREKLFDRCQRAVGPIRLSLRYDRVEDANDVGALDIGERHVVQRLEALQAAPCRVLVAVFHHHVLGDELRHDLAQRESLALFSTLITSELIFAEDFARLLACISEADERITADRVSHLPTVYPSAKGEGLTRWVSAFSPRYRPWSSLPP